VNAQPELLRLEGVGVRLGGRQILRDVSFTVRPGEFGTIVAVTSGIVGVLTVIRGQSFAGHSLADVATTGGAGAFLAGVNQFWGFLIAGVAGATSWS
jgi:ABC-type Mn2+/Zn2+ transport system permease subunit